MFNIRLRGLTFQLSILILASAGMISILLYGYNFIHTSQIIYKEVNKNAKSTVESTAHRLETLVSTVEKVTYNTRTFLENTDFSKEEIEKYLKRTVEKNEEIYGSSICFEPFMFDSASKLASWYYYKDGGVVKFSDLSADEYNYPSQPWYTGARDNEGPVWSEPYYDEGGGNVLMSTFSIPFYKNTNSGKVFSGVITCDVELSRLQSDIAHLQVYETGYGLILSKDGRFLAHPDTSLIMKKTVFDVAVERGIPVLNELGKRMMAGEEGEITTKSVISQKVSLVRFYPIRKNGWSVAIVFPHEEIYRDRDRLVIEIVVFGILGFLVLFFVLVWVARRISKPLKAITSLSEMIAEGDLQAVALQLESSQWDNYKQILNANKGKKQLKNEVIRLYVSVEKMVQDLYSLIMQVQKTSIQVASSSNEIAASSRELEANATEQAASTKEVSATSKNISATSESLTESIHEINKKSENALNLAHTSKESLQLLDNALRSLNDSTRSITSKLSVINEKANKISSVVTAINKISEQTNLLSFNAAIEAEKAGEYGKGFAVVAREISRLADQTAVATDDIEKMVREMQSSVSSGVMEMDKFSDQVRKGADQIYSFSNQISMVIEEVNDFAPSFGHFASGMDEQNEAASQISEAMTQLAKASEQSKEALGEFRRATLQLNDAVMGLQSEITKFKI